jgi:SAM-dependent methyltransferase
MGSQPDAYSSAFAARGSDYDRAMRAHPGVRVREFAQVIEAAELQPGMVVGDVPAGGGYLQQYMSSTVRCMSHEPCASFGQGHHGAGSLFPFPWTDGSLDRVISLAGVHHHPDKRPFHAEVHRVLVPGGLYVLSDVDADSPVGRFLDGFVGRHNGTGHDGIYLGAELVPQLTEAGFSVRSDQLVRFLWSAPDDETLADFCIGLFSLSGVTRDEFLEVASRELGIERSPGATSLRWELRTVVSQRE